MGKGAARQKSAVEINGLRLRGISPTRFSRQEKMESTEVESENAMGVDNPAKVIELSIHGTVYDVTEFAKEHPGGTVIVSKANPDHLPWPADATAAFMGMHSRSRIPSQVLARLAKEGKSRKWTEAEKAAFAKSAPSGAILEEEFLKVTRELEKDGMFKASMLHTTYRLVELIAILLWGFHSLENSGVGWWFGTFLIGFAWSRAGWIQHEAHHGSLFGNYTLDKYAAKAVVGLVNGASSEWWKRNHNRHHATTQHHGYDPDMNGAPLAAFDTRTSLKCPIEQSVAARVWLTVQHIAWPFTAGMALLHWLWVVHPLFAIKRGHWVDIGAIAVQHMIFFYMSPAGCTFANSCGMHAVAAWWTGFFLFINFAISHSPMPAIGKEERDESWVSSAFQHTIDVHSHPGPLGWLQDHATSWFMGYLNFQVAHHLWPTMPQFRQADPKVHAALRRLVAADPQKKLKYHVTTYWQGLYYVWANQKAVTRQRLSLKNGPVLPPKDELIPLTPPDTPLRYNY